MPSIKPLDRLTADDLAAAGAKAYHCARLRRLGIPVPDGVVVLAPEDNAPPVLDALDAALAPFPDGTLFAVRSSAVDEDGAAHSFAGIHETRLNVPREGV